MKPTILLILILTFQFFCYSQQPIKQTIRGTVTDIDSKMELPGATIQIVNSEKGTTSDEKGNFRLENIPIGRYDILVSFLGYKPKYNVP